MKYKVMNRILTVLITGFVNMFSAGLLLFSFACASEPSEEEIPQMYGISGTITKSDGGVASGATVQLQGATDGNSAGQTTVDVTGAYVFASVPAGGYQIIITLDGYETATVSGVEVSNADISGRDAVLQKIAAPTYSISGTVTKAGGSAAAGASVQVKKAGDNVNVGQAATADAAGAYSIHGIPSGEYNIITALDGYETGILSGVTVTNAGLTSQNITLNIITVNANAVSIIYSDNDATIGNLPADGSITATKNGANVTLSSVAPGLVEYVVSGSTSDGSLKIQNNADVPNTLRLTLNSAVITSASELPPIQITKNEGITIVELKGLNILSDNAANDENATLISKSGALEFEGYGRLNIIGAAKHAIASSKKSITVRGGNITVASAASDGFHADAGFGISGGSLDITASGDGIDAGSGTAVISGGNIRILSAADDTKSVKSDDNMTVNGGEITITVSGKQSKGLSSKKDIVINNGNIAIETSGATVLTESENGYDPSYCTAIKAGNNITVNSGTLTVNSLKTADGGKGLSADGDISITGGNISITTAGDGAIYRNESGATDSYTACCIKADQNIYLLGGTLNCNSSGSGGKGISAGETLTIGTPGANNADLQLNVGTSGQRFLVSGTPGGWYSSADYANPKAIKSEGNMTVNSGTVRISCTQTTEGGEALESKSIMTVNGGDIEIHTYDDCINAETGILINDGYIYCVSTGNDGIDSNGTMTIAGGFIVSNGSRGVEDGFDSDNKVFKITGGVIIGTGGNTSNPTVNVSTQRSVKYTGTPGNAVCITNASGEIILLYRMPAYASGGTGGGNNNMVMLFTDPRLADGRYTLQYGGTITGGQTKNGYNTGGSYSGGSTISFTINSIFTNVQ
jgi:hypothetical protein